MEIFIFALCGEIFPIDLVPFKKYQHCESISEKYMLKQYFISYSKRVETICFRQNTLRKTTTQIIITIRYDGLEAISKGVSE